MQLSSKIEQLSSECGSQMVGEGRWFRPSIKHSQDVPLVGEAESIVFIVSLEKKKSIGEDSFDCVG